MGGEMTKDDIIKLAHEAGFFVKDAEVYSSSVQYDYALTPFFERFAKLVVANINPKSFMSWQEGYEAGVVAEREACAGLLESRKTNANSLIDAVRDMEAAAIRARKTT